MNNTKKVIQIDDYRPKIVGQWTVMCVKTGVTLEKGPLWDKPGWNIFKDTPEGEAPRGAIKPVANFSISKFFKDFFRRRGAALALRKK